MPLCTTCHGFFRTQVFDFYIADVTDEYPHHFSLAEFLKSIDQKCFICWRIFRNSFTSYAKARGYLERIARLTSSPERVAERAWLSPDRRCVTNVWAGRRRMWPMFNKEYLHALKVSHEDLSELLPDIEALETLVQPKGNDDNGRAGGSMIALLREPSGTTDTILSGLPDIIFPKHYRMLIQCRL